MVERILNLNAHKKRNKIHYKQKLFFTEMLISSSILHKYLLKFLQLSPIRRMESQLIFTHFLGLKQNIVSAFIRSLNPNLKKN